MGQLPLTSVVCTPSLESSGTTVLAGSYDSQVGLLKCSCKAVGQHLSGNHPCECQTHLLPTMHVRLLCPASCLLGS